MVALALATWLFYRERRFAPSFLPQLARLFELRVRPVPAAANLALGRTTSCRRHAVLLSERTTFMRYTSVGGGVARRYPSASLTRSTSCAEVYGLRRKPATRVAANRRATLLSG